MLLRNIWHLIYPRCCVMCDKVLYLDEEHFCPDCLKQLPKTEHAVYRDNKAELLFEDDKLIRGGAYCFYPKDHPFRQVIQRMKFDSQPEVGYFLGKKAAEEWLDSGFFEDIDCIIPLPLHWIRLRQRGYNQSEWIARGLSEATGIPLDTSHLYRLKNNAHQSEMTIHERKQLEQIFGLRNANDLRNKHVLLVDDVITSGSTMARAMQVLHAVPGCRYAVFSLALAGM